MHIFLISSLLLGTTCAGTIDFVNFQSIVEKVNSMKTTWKADTNFTKYVPLSSLQHLTGSVSVRKRLPLKQGNEITYSNSIIPEEFDARKQWPECPSIRHISDQSHCGSCWAVSTAAAFSDRLCIATKGKFTSQLSARELISCFRGEKGCSGGDPPGAWRYSMTNGLVTGGDYNSTGGCQPYPFPSCDHTSFGSHDLCSSLPKYTPPKCEKKCTNSAYGKPFEEDLHKVKSAYELLDIEDIQRDIMTHGPVVAVYIVAEDFYTYKSGVYHHVTGKFVAGHAVRVIGWGTEDGTPYWLVANSWNSNWGDNGFFKIRRGVGECTIDLIYPMYAGIPDV